MKSLPIQLQPGTGQRLFAWNGLAFLTPKDWELSQAELSKGVNRIVLDDDSRPRLELDWLVPGTVLDQDKVQKSCQKQARELTELAEAVTEVAGLGGEWTAHEYRMPDGRVLLIGYRVPEEEGTPFVFFRLHFDRAMRISAPVCFREIVKSFTWFGKGLAPWSFYDVEFWLNRDFRLVATSLQAGRKTLSFEWKLRRLFVWYFSLADLALQNKSLGQWAADFLNQSRLLPVPLWHAVGEDGLAYRRRRLYFAGQFEEIGRMCFHYRAEAHHLADKNQIVLWVMQYRRDSDWARLAADGIGDETSQNEVSEHDKI